MPIQYGKDSNFKGKKERSGRYSCADEALKNRVKHRAWLMKEERMNDNEAIQIVTKDMTLKTEHSGQVIIMNYDDSFKTSPETAGSDIKSNEIQSDTSGA